MFRVNSLEKQELNVSPVNVMLTYLTGLINYLLCLLGSGNCLGCYLTSEPKALPVHQCLGKKLNM